MHSKNSLLFSSGIYEHAAVLIEERPAAVSRDADLLYCAQSKAWQLYRHPMLVAGIDVYDVELEAFGAVLSQPADDGVPCIISHPFTSIEALLQLNAPDPSRTSRMPMVLAVARRLVSENLPTTVYVPVCGPLALAGGLIGMDKLLCSMMEEPGMVLAALSQLARIQGQ